MRLRFSTRKTRALGALLGGLLAVAAIPAARANDGIFPSAPAARPYIDFDGRGFLINGKRTFVASGSLHYARLPRAQWRDRLLRFKRAGFNTVQTYVFWNYHEPQEGKFDFSGDKDLDAYLKLIKELGMYAVVRVGPYSCAEWDSGGYPVWLRFKPGVRVREPNAEFEAAVDRWFDTLLPIVAANQINRGGSVIMVQLENEHKLGWGTEMPNEYFQHLRDKAVAKGIEVPYFFSGLHHGSDPAGNKAWDSAGRSNPWYTTEFWPGWYDLYGPLDDGRLRRFDRGTWKILAYGGNGYNFYMLYGGTNFDYWNNNEDASSYDYGSAVGQAGDLRPIYYRFKRATWFARSFQSILEDSQNATEQYQGAVTNPAIRMDARRGPAGTILFLDNNSDNAVETQVKVSSTTLPSSGSITLAPGEIMPVVLNYALVPGVTLQAAPTRILGTLEQGDTTTLVIYGPTSAPAELQFAVPADTVVNKGEPELALASPGQLVLKTEYPAGSPTEYAFTTGGKHIRIVVVSDVLADDTWFVEGGKQNYVVCGPDYVADADDKSGRLHVTTESPSSAMPPAMPVAYGPGEEPIPLQPQNTDIVALPAAPTLGSWESLDAAGAIKPGYDDHDWKTGKATPLPMGADGDISAYAWYRASLNAPSAGTYSLAFTAARDEVAPFLDGVRIPEANIHGNTAKLDLTPGAHTLAVFTSHHGRDKLFGYLGPIDMIDAKGLSGPVALRQGGESGTPVTGWKMIPGGATPRENRTPPGADAQGWTDVAIGQDVFQGRRGFIWFQTTLPTTPGDAAHKALHFDSVDDNATVFLNGRMITRHSGWNDAFDVPIAGAWRKSQPNVLTVLVENTDGAGGIMGAVSLATYRTDDRITGWKLRGGPGDPLATTGWKPLAAGDALSAPTFFRTRFTLTPPAADGPHPILRVSMRGMGHGSVWLNGHNLGRYPEKVPVDGLYLPESWLKAGENQLVVFSEEGGRPDQITLVVETAASRNVADLFGPQ